jgi:hypothetical protein
MILKFIKLVIKNALLSTGTSSLWFLVLHSAPQHPLCSVSARFFFGSLDYFWSLRATRSWINASWSPCLVCSVSPLNFCCCLFLRLVLVWVPCTPVCLCSHQRFLLRCAIYDFLDVLSVLVGGTRYCSWDIRSKARVFLILIVLRSMFLCHTHQMFGEICVRTWVAFLAWFWLSKLRLWLGLCRLILSLWFEVP